MAGIMPNPVGFSHYSGLSGGSQPRRSVSNVRIVVWDCNFRVVNSGGRLRQLATRLDAHG